MPHLVNKAELAEILGRSQQTLTTWQKQGMPIHFAGTRGTENLYSTEEVIDWLIRRELSRAVGADPNGELINYEAERARLTRAQANHEELKVEVLRGELIPSDTVERVQGAMVSAFRARCLSIPTKAAPQLVGQDEPTIESVLTEYVFEALEELSDFDPSAYIPAGRGDSETPAAANSEPVGGRESSPKRGGKRGARTLAH